MNNTLKWLLYSLSIVGLPYYIWKVATEHKYAFLFFTVVIACFTIGLASNGQWFAAGFVQVGFGMIACSMATPKSKRSMPDPHDNKVGKEKLKQK